MKTFIEELEDNPEFRRSVARKKIVMYVAAAVGCACEDAKVSDRALAKKLRWGAARIRRAFEGDSGVDDLSEILDAIDHTIEVKCVPRQKADQQREAAELRALLSEVLNSKSVVGSHPIKSYLSEPLLKRVEEAFKGVCSTCAGTGFVPHDCDDSTCGQSVDDCSDCTRNT